MIKINHDRNSSVHELWKNGCTIDEICSETGIPRSTVGYYVRKFNKNAKRGEPIIFQHTRKKQDDLSLVIQANNKYEIIEKLSKMVKNDELDKAYKTLSIYKLMKELGNYISPTNEESEAFIKNVYLYFNKLASLKNEI